MKTPSKLTEAIAKKAFGTPKLQQSWAVHMQAFGPILSPAYQDCYTARVHITSILNQISRSDVTGAKATMRKLEQSCGCDTDAEKALWHFMEGLCSKVSGDTASMLNSYTLAGQYNHRFYLPYVELAKAAHKIDMLDMACGEYTKALDCIRDMPQGEQRSTLLSLVLTSLASCLTFMHRYADALNTLEEAKSTKPLKNMEAVEAVLLAALDREEEMEACLIALAEADSPAYDDTLDTVQCIMDGNDPHFTVIPADADFIAAFWQWFESNEPELSRLSTEDPKGLNTLLCDHLEPCFPFDHPELQVHSVPAMGARELRFIDFYNRSLAAGYEALIAACPPELAARWELITES